MTRSYTCMLNTDATSASMLTSTVASSPSMKTDLRCHIAFQIRCEALGTGTASPLGGSETQSNFSNDTILIAVPFALNAGQLLSAFWEAATNQPALACQPTNGQSCACGAAR